ncbi:MAG: hypothetical protein HC929_08120 [Leptolyngbyaceae cyanobacterium SM2_5_2]|nr:hypothetical protein [Leptolyngbyaceae cyanobacterium SM2_5_2]
MRDYYSLDVSGNRTFPIRRADQTFDSRLRPWYQAAISAEGPAWTEVYIAFTTGLPTSPPACPCMTDRASNCSGFVPPT